MTSKTSIVTKKLMNLYRQHHVIYGGWVAINPIFLDEADDNILSELKRLPTGNRLVKHIENLRSGKTPMDSIDKKLLPYGRLMTDTSVSVPLSTEEIAEIKQGLSEFTPDESGLDKIKSLSSVQKFGSEWLVGIRSALSGDQESLKKLEPVKKTYHAYHLWESAKEVLSAPISDRTRAKVQAELPEFETFLPMFGDAGEAMLAKLRRFIMKS